MTGRGKARAAMTRGVICVDGPVGLTYRVCRIQYAVWEDGAFEYRFAPDYRVIDLLSPPLFDGIPGLDLELRRAEYVRRGRVPVFISERAPAANREDLWKLLGDVGMEYPNQLEWLIRTDTRYSGDNLYVIRDEGEPEPRPLEAGDAIAQAANTEHALRQLLGGLARGDGLAVRGRAVDDGSRGPLHDVLLLLLEKGSSYRARASAEKAAGSKRGAPRRVGLDAIALDDALGRYLRREVTAREAAAELGMSESTFYRRLHERSGGGGE